MSKKSTLLRGYGETEELQRIINNYNAKLYRLQKSHPELSEYLPNRVTKTEVLESVDSRTELKKLQNSLQRFSKRGSEKLVDLPQGGKATQYSVDELKRSVKSFNAKVIRVWKKDAENRDNLPARVTTKELLQSAEKQADLERINSSLQRFSKKGAEKFVKSSRGAKATQWEVDEFYRKQELENEKRRQQREKIKQEEVKIGGEGTGQTRAQMGSIKENSLRESKKNFNNMSQKEWELASKNIDNQLDAKYKAEKNELMRENYIKGLTDNGFIGDVPELEEWIRSVDFDTFLTTVETDETATFFFYKDPIAYEARKEKIVGAWKTAYQQSQYEKGLFIGAINR